MSFNRADYERLVAIAREISYLTDVADDLAQELFDMAESVIGQQMPPLFGDQEMGDS